MTKTLSVTAALLLSLILRAQPAPADSVLARLRSMPADSHKVNLLRDAGISVIYQSPPAAIPYFRQAISLAHELRFDPGLERAYAATSTAYAFNARYDSCLAYIDTAIYYAKKVGDVNRLALVYLNRADAHENLSRLPAALKDCDTAMVYAQRSGNKDRLARIYSVFSEVYKQQGQDANALSYLEKAYALQQELKNEQMAAQTRFLMAMLHRRMGALPQARAAYLEAIQTAERIGDRSSLSSYYGDYASLLVEGNQVAQALPLAGKALDYARKMQNPLQEAVIHDLFYNIYLKQNRLNEAIASGLATYSILKEHKSLSREQVVVSQLAEAYAKAGDSRRAYEFMKLSASLNDSLLKQRFTKESAELQTAFDVAQKDREIQLLNKDRELQEQKLSRQRVVLVGSVALAALALAGIGLFLSRYRLRQRMKELQLRQEIAADLHDEVGSSLSSIHMLSEMASARHDASQQEVLHKVSAYTRETMDKMGDIVWMIKPAEQDSVSLKERMERFLYEFCAGKNMQCSFEGEVLDSIRLDIQKRKSLYLVFKEAVNNALKYSGADRIEVRVSTGEGHLQLLIRDNGKGFDIGRTRQGNGLGNMQKRALEQHGQTAIQSAPGAGTTVHFRIPL